MTVGPSTRSRSYIRPVQTGGALKASGGGHYIQPGKPDQNAYIDRFNLSDHTEVLKAHLLESIAELQALTITWCGSTTRSGRTTASVRVRLLTFLPRSTP